LASDVVTAGGAVRKQGWRIKEWGDDVGLRKSRIYELINSREIVSVKIGGARIITTTPADFLSQAADQD
jgi:hypothetical protein